MDKKPMMRSIPLRKTKINIRQINPKTGKPENVVEEFDYKTNLENILYTMPTDDRNGQSRGFTAKENLMRLKILGLLEDAKDSVLLSEEDYNVLKEAVLAQRWSILAEAIAEFIQDVESAKLVEVEAKTTK
jgi:hypothetical protein